VRGLCGAVGRIPILDLLVFLVIGPL